MTAAIEASVLSVPEIVPTKGTMAAAIDYAGSGWFLGPLAVATKNPGSVLGSRWPEHTVCSAADVVSLFAGRSFGVFLHPGRSGAVVFDVDAPARMPRVLREAIEAAQPPFQQTRPDAPSRGHYVFRQPPGRRIGNGLGRLAAGWGEVRGINGAIVVAPTMHPDGGLYQWRRSGLVPVLPDSLARLLPDVDARPLAGVTTGHVAEWLRTRGAGQPCSRIERTLDEARVSLAQAVSRHDAALRFAASIIGSASRGHRGADYAIRQLRAMFADAVRGEPERRGEFERIVSSAVGKYAVGAPAEPCSCSRPAVSTVNDLPILSLRTRTDDQDDDVVGNHVALIEASSGGSAGSGGSPDRLAEPTAALLDDIRAWFARFICTVAEEDLDLLALWAAHTHVCMETYTTPRLLIDSVVPGSGKTTVLEHLQRLCLRPVQIASLSSPALLTRMLDAELRTVLIDEADRSLSKDKDGVGDLLAVLNSGYKRGSTRPVLVPAGSTWEVKEMPTFAPVAMAGNNPDLPVDTQSRSLRVLLLPDVDGVVEDSDWEVLEDDAQALGARLGAWANDIRNSVRARPEMPDQVRGRARERWAPLKRVAIAAGGRWPDVVDRMAVEDVERFEAEKDEGLVQQKPEVVLLTHIHHAFNNEAFLSTSSLIDRLVNDHPETWGQHSSYGKKLTPQRLGRMLSHSYNVRAGRLDDARGYHRASLATAFRRFGLPTPIEPTEPAEPAEPPDPALSR